jgi:hypothetical protein
MKTIVLQTFRSHDVPHWMDRCMSSVRDWAAAQGYAYRFEGDSVFAFCGDAYLAAVGDNKRSITNLARLEWIRATLAAGWDRAIWLDADTFIFDPAGFSMDVRSGYACAKGMWIDMQAGRPTVKHEIHNAALVFAGHHPDLDRMIDLIRYIAATRPIERSFQVGIHLLAGLHAGLRFPLLPGIGTFGPVMIHALARSRTGILRLAARENECPMRAANFCFSGRDLIRDQDVEDALTALERSRGAILNRHLPRGAPDPLVVAEPGVNQRPRLRPGFSQWLLRGVVPRPVKRALRRLTHSPAHPA